MNYENFIATAGSRVYSPCFIRQCAFQIFGQAAIYRGCLAYLCKMYC